jgi:hypothetical protein
VHLIGKPPKVSIQDRRRNLDFQGFILSLAIDLSKNQ